MYAVITSSSAAWPVMLLLPVRCDCKLDSARSTASKLLRGLGGDCGRCSLSGVADRKRLDCPCSRSSQPHPLSLLPRAASRHRDHHSLTAGTESPSSFRVDRRPLGFVCGHCHWKLTEGDSWLLHYSRCGSVTGECADDIPLKVQHRVLVSACPVQCAFLEFKSCHRFRSPD